MRIWILGATLVASAFAASITGAEAATQCQAEIVKGRTSHWTYRLIDGRKCWYEGKTQLPKSDLYWGDRKEPEEAAEAAIPSAKPAAPEVKRATPARPLETNAQASPAPAASNEEFIDPEDGSCCWPPQRQDSFESRWQSLGLRSAN